MLGGLKRKPMLAAALARPGFMPPGGGGGSAPHPMPLGGPPTLGDEGGPMPVPGMLNKGFQNLPPGPAPGPGPMPIAQPSLGGLSGGLGHMPPGGGPTGLPPRPVSGPRPWNGQPWLPRQIGGLGRGLHRFNPHALNKRAPLAY